MMKITIWPFPGRQAQGKTTHVKPHRYMPRRIQMVQWQNSHGKIALSLLQYSSPLKRLLEIEHSTGLNVAKCLPQCWLLDGCLHISKKRLAYYVCAKDHVNVSVQTRVKNISNTRNLSLRISVDIFPAGGTACHALAKRAMPECLNYQTISTARLLE